MEYGNAFNIEVWMEISELSLAETLLSVLIET